jgi:hypothetical protein
MWTPSDLALDAPAASKAGIAERPRDSRRPAHVRTLPERLRSAS